MENSRVERAAVAAASPRKQGIIRCSQCGNQFGLGLDGFSSCTDHQRLDAPVPKQVEHCTAGLQYVLMYSEYMSANLRVGVELVADDEWHGADGYSAAGSDYHLQEIWMCGVELTPFLQSSVFNVVEAEARERLVGVEL